MHGVARPGGYVFVRGELWRARTDDGEIAPGEQVQVDALDGLTLDVHRIES
jgi:membrane-bound ClpP family serine protease